MAGDAVDQVDLKLTPVQPVPAFLSTTVHWRGGYVQSTAVRASQRRERGQTEKDTPSLASDTMQHQHTGMDPNSESDVSASCARPAGRWLGASPRRSKWTVAEGPIHTHDTSNFTRNGTGLLLLAPKACAAELPPFLRLRANQPTMVSLPSAPPANQKRSRTELARPQSTLDSLVLPLRPAKKRSCNNVTTTAASWGDDMISVDARVGGILLPGKWSP